MCVRVCVSVCVWHVCVFVYVCSCVCGTCVCERVCMAMCAVSQDVETTVSVDGGVHKDGVPRTMARSSAPRKDEVSVLVTCVDLECSAPSEVSRTEGDGCL